MEVLWGWAFSYGRGTSPGRANRDARYNDETPDALSPVVATSRPRLEVRSKDEIVLECRFTTLLRKALHEKKLVELVGDALSPGLSDSRAESEPLGEGRHSGSLQGVLVNKDTHRLTGGTRK